MSYEFKELSVGGIDEVGFSFTENEDSSVLAKLDGPITDTLPTQQNSRSISDIPFGLEIYNTNIYIAENNTDQLRVYDGDTLDLLWSHSHHNGYVRGVAVQDNVVYTGSADGKVIAANATTGNKIWEHSHNINHQGIDIISVDKTGVYSMGDDDVVGANLSDGSLQWQTETDQELFNDSMAIGDSVVVLLDETGDMYIIDKSTGNIQNKINVHSGRVKGVKINNNIVYTASENEGVKASNADTGSEQWSFTTVNSTTDVDIYQDTVFASEDSGTVYALNTSDGTKIWESGFPSDSLVKIAVTGDRIYAGSHPSYSIDKLKYATYERTAESYSPYVSDGISWHQV